MTLGARPATPPAGYPQTASEPSTKSRAFPHRPAAHELRRAWLTAKTLAEQLEVADEPVLHRIAVYLREQVFVELVAAEGYQEADEQC